MLNRLRIQIGVAAAGLLLGAAGLGLLAGCGADRAGPDPAGAGPGQVGSDDISAFTDLFATLHTDYEAVGTPAALAEQSALVVEGRIDRIDQGRRFGTSATDPVASTTVVLVVTVAQVWHGSMPAAAGDTVYVELPAPGNVDAQVFDQAAPRHHDTLLYLAPAAEPHQTAIVDPAAGRPSGQPLYQPTNPQSILVQGETEVVQILGHTGFPGSTLRDFLPSSPRFPTVETSGHQD